MEPEHRIRLRGELRLALGEHLQPLMPQLRSFVPRKVDIQLEVPRFRALELRVELPERLLQAAAEQAEALRRACLEQRT